jgi:hypothetical protein
MPASSQRCASVGKITRINALLSTPLFRQKYPRRRPTDEFRIIDGFIDILLPSIASGAAGVSVPPSINNVKGNPTLILVLNYGRLFQDSPTSCR